MRRFFGFLLTMALLGGGVFWLPYLQAEPVDNVYQAADARRDIPGILGEIPIVAMTANAFEEDRRKALESGMNAHIAKPVDVSDLLETLSRFS